MNTIRHKVGDKVIALSDPLDESCQPRKKGNIYVVRAVMYCSKCGEQKINIGFPSQVTTGFPVCGCGCIGSDNVLAWTYSSHFAPIQDIESEDYELAGMLTHNTPDIKPKQ